jgi:F420-non-reducing hydrogenase small subunit
MSILDLHEALIEFLKAMNIVYSPLLVDTKEIPDCDVAFIEGGINDTTHIEIAKEVRDKTKIVVGFGSCASFGGINGLRNLYSLDELMDKNYISAESVKNQATKKYYKIRVIPTGYGLPKLLPIVKPLHEVITVDYKVPGCPPPTEFIGAAFLALFGEEEKVDLPEVNLCKECELKVNLENPSIIQTKRFIEEKIESKICFLDQGIFCLGQVTRGGCGAICTHAGVPCTGCMGPLSKYEDFGSAVLDSLMGKLKLDELDVEVLYRFTLPSSLIPARQQK